MEMIGFVGGILTSALTGAAFGLWFDPHEQGPEREMYLLGSGLAAGYGATLMIEQRLLMSSFLILTMSPFYLIPITVYSGLASSHVKNSVIKWYHEK